MAYQAGLTLSESPAARFGDVVSALVNSAIIPSGATQPVSVREGVR
jgi:hypothetical protein